jgi:hypothetical protein
MAATDQGMFPGTGTLPRIDPDREDAWTSGTITPMPPPAEAQALTT